MSYDLTLRIWRGDGNGGDLKDYVVPAEEGQVVLDAVHRAQASQANDLAVRWNCKAGKCGSCSAEVNGIPRLMCMTRLSVLPEGEPVTITPLRTFPVIKDLVTDVSFNYQKAREVPAFTPTASQPVAPFTMYQSDVERSQEFRKCIECWLCQNTCHVIRDHEENKPVLCRPAFLHPLRRTGHAPQRRPRPKAIGAGLGGSRLLQYHEMLYRSLPGAHKDHR